jgi:hypothetical protein
VDQQAVGDRAVTHSRRYLRLAHLRCFRRSRCFRPRARHLVYVAGLSLIGVGTAGLLADAADTVPPAWAAWFVGVVLAHDLLVAPAVLAVSMLLARLPASWRSALQAGTVVAATLTVATLPTVLAYGRRTDNKSVLPLDYPPNLLIVLAAIALGAGTVAALRAGSTRGLRARTHSRSRSRRSTDDEDQSQ